VTTRPVARRIGAMAMSEGAGVTVRRTIGLPASSHLDPFLMLDHFSSDDPHDYIAGFPDHPHRGFVTLTHMIDGHMEHRDSMGNRGNLGPGGAQWMKAASGVIHSEMPRQTDGLMRGFQLWVNLPAAEKMSAPAYQEYAADRIPRVTTPAGATVRVLSGEFAGRRGPVDDPFTRVLYLDVTVPAGELFRHAVERSASGFVYPFDGAVVVGGAVVQAHQLAVLGDGDHVEIAAESGQSRFILVTGHPLGEPVARYGPFVMNTPEEIELALADYRDDRLVRMAATVDG
jgi:redox-sensitive bicupin YhaK (pirin superfamily)